MLYVGRFVSLKESSHYDETPLASCVRILIPTQLVAKNKVQEKEEAGKITEKKEEKM